jgi:hypothetical protein
MASCARNQHLSHTEHFLVSAYGHRWQEVNLAAFSIYVDDSGTSSDQPLAVASALIVPAAQIARISALWKSFREKHGFSYLHASEMATPNRKGQYAGWSDDKVRLVLSRARQIIKMHSTSAFVWAIHKDVFDRETPTEWRDTGGENHYTWAVRSLLRKLIAWHREHAVTGPFEFTFDNAVGRDRDEIEMVMAEVESECPGWIEGHYSFRCKANVPCLQGADLLAWSAYSLGRLMFLDIPASTFAVESMRDFRTHRKQEWLNYLTYDQEHFKQVIATDLNDAAGALRRQQWHQQWISDLKVGRTRRPPSEKCPC